MLFVADCVLWYQADPEMADKFGTKRKFAINVMKNDLDGFHKNYKYNTRFSRQDILKLKDGMDKLVSYVIGCEENGIVSKNNPKFTLNLEMAQEIYQFVPELDYYTRLKYGMPYDLAFYTESMFDSDKLFSAIPPHAKLWCDLRCKTAEKSGFYGDYPTEGEIEWVYEQNEEYNNKRKAEEQERWFREEMKKAEKERQRQVFIETGLDDWQQSEYYDPFIDGF